MQHSLIHPLFAAGSPGFHWDATGLVAVVGGYCIPIVIIGLGLFFRYRRRKLQHETLRMFIEKGQPIPPELMREQWADYKYQPARRNDLRRGLIWLAIGLALVFGNADFGGLPGPGTGFHISRIGLIPLFIGVAFIICWMVEGKGSGNTTAPSNPSAPTTNNPGNPSGPTPG